MTSRGIVGKDSAGNPIHDMVHRPRLLMGVESQKRRFPWFTWALSLPLAMSLIGNLFQADAIKLANKQRNAAIDLLDQVMPDYLMLKLQSLPPDFREMPFPMPPPPSKIKARDV